MKEFRFVRISELFVAELGGLVARGESLVLLGPRNIGKRYLIHQLVGDMAPLAACRVGMVSFLSEAPDEGEIRAEAADGPAPWLARLEPRPSAVLRWVDDQLGSGEGRVTLFATNVDALPHSEIQEFLSGLGERVEGRGRGAGRLAVVLTGEVRPRPIRLRSPVYVRPREPVPHPGIRPRRVPEVRRPLRRPAGSDHRASGRRPAG